MSKKIPEYLISKAVNCKLLIFVTLFSIVFVNVYTPFEYSTWFNTSSSTLRIIYAVAATIAGVSILAVSRIIMHYVYKKNTLTILHLDSGGNSAYSFCIFFIFMLFAG